LAKNRLPKTETSIPGKLRPFKTTDLPAIAALYDLRAGQLWLQPQRTRQWWADRGAEMDSEQAELKEVPFPKKENFKVWENVNGETAGYLDYRDPDGNKPLIINEAAALDYPTAAAMLVCFMDQSVKDGETIVIRGTPEHYLNMAAYRLGGTHLNPAPLAGMIKVLDWPAFCSQIKPLITGRADVARLDRPVTVAFRSGQQLFKLKLTQAGGEITASAAAIPALSEAQLTRLIFGLADAAEWEALLPQAQALQQLFPSRFPFIWDANYLY
jgi:hypothetical protein